MHLDGMSLREIERRYGFDRKELADWVRRYQRDGVEGILRKKKARTTYELRRRIVAEHLEEGVAFADLCLKYDICRSTLKDWVTAVRRSGYEALQGARARAQDQI